jgi:hypothetical protein
MRAQIETNNARYAHEIDQARVDIESKMSSDVRSKDFEILGLSRKLEEF